MPALRGALLLALAAPLLACFPFGKDHAVVTIGLPTYVCVVVNDRFLALAVVRLRGARGRDGVAACARARG